MLLLFLCILGLIKSGNCLLCFECHQTTSACLYGYTDQLYIRNCTVNSSCLVVSYETYVRGSKVIAARRGCIELGKSTSGDICQTMKKSVVENNQTKTNISCRTCDKWLCNSSGVPTLSIIQLLIVFSLPFTLFR